MKRVHGLRPHFDERDRQLTRSMCVRLTEVCHLYKDVTKTRTVVDACCLLRWIGTVLGVASSRTSVRPGGRRRARVAILPCIQEEYVYKVCVLAVRGVLTCRLLKDSNCLSPDNKL